MIDGPPWSGREGRRQLLLELGRYEAETRSRRVIRGVITTRGPDGSHLPNGRALIAVDLADLQRGALEHGTRLVLDGARWFAQGREVTHEAFVDAARRLT